MAVDPIVNLTEFLVNSSIVNSVQGMLGGIDLPVGIDISLGPFLLFRSQGGYPDYSDATKSPDVIFEAYAQHEDQAAEILRQLEEVLNNKRGYGIIYARKISEAYVTRDPDLKWPLASIFYRIRTRS